MDRKGEDFELEVVWVVYDDGNDMPIVACYYEQEAKAIAETFGDQFIEAKRVPMVTPYGSWRETGEGAHE